MIELKIAVQNKQSDIWRLEAERSRLRINIMEFDVRLLDAETSRKKQILTELEDVRQRLHDTEVALPSAREIRAAMLRQTGGLVSGADIRNMKVTRLRDGEVSTFDVSETTLLEPGDILEIRAQRNLGHHRLLRDPPSAAGSALGSLSCFNTRAAMSRERRISTSSSMMTSALASELGAPVLFRQVRVYEDACRCRAARRHKPDEARLAPQGNHEKRQVDLRCTVRIGNDAGAVRLGIVKKLGSGI